MEFKEVNIENYVNDIVSEGAKLEEFKKFARIKAEQGKVGQVIVTVMKNGLEETKNVVKEDAETGEPDWIVTNPDGEKYCVPDKTFRKKYEIADEKEGIYKPKGGAVKAVQIEENISFVAPWGEQMNIAKGGYLIVNGPKDIYGIQLEEFNNTYKPASEVDKMFEQENQKIAKTKKDIELNRN